MLDDMRELLRLHQKKIVELGALVERIAETVHSLARTVQRQQEAIDDINSRMGPLRGSARSGDAGTDG